MLARSTLIVLALLLAGCTVGPEYHRPKIAIPETFRAPAPLPADEAASLGDLRWFEVLDTRGHIENGRVAHWQVTMKLGFTLDSE